MLNQCLRNLLLTMAVCMPVYTSCANWTLLVYIQSDNDLNAAVCKNLYDLSRAQTDASVNVLVQVQVYGNAGLRCVVEGGQIKPVGLVRLNLVPREDLRDSMQWAYGNYPAQDYGLILGSHGFGVLDPVWNAETNDFRPEVDTDYQAGCDIKFALHNPRKGILFDSEHQTYLNNADMVDVLADIVQNTLDGQRIAFMGMDACKMAMAEIAYQVAPYVQYIMGSQECELLDGYDYTACGNALMQQPDVVSVVSRMVNSYKDYYQDIASQYTQSGISTDAMAAVVTNMNVIIQYLLDNAVDYADTLTAVRDTRTQFCEQPSYVDVYDFYGALAQAIDGQDALLSDLLAHGKDLVNAAVVANIAGPRAAHAHGISIYYPKVYTPSSYAACAFARDTLWIRLLETFAV